MSLFVNCAKNYEVLTYEKKERGVIQRRTKKKDSEVKFFGRGEGGGFI